MAIVRFGLCLLLTTVVLAAGCSREGGLRCDDPGRYLGSATVPPLRIPDDLNPPDETNALRIPDGSDTVTEPAPEDGAETEDAEPTCVEAPPEYSTETPD